MEPNDKASKGAADLEAEEKAAVDSLHAEGIDIMGPGESFDEDAASESNAGAESVRPEKTGLPPAQDLSQDFNPVEISEEELEKPSGLSAAENKLYAVPEATVASNKPKTEGLPSDPSADRGSKTALQNDIAGILKEKGAVQKTEGEKGAAKNDPSIKPLRTFKTDAEEAIRRQNISTVDIAIAAQKKKQESTPIEYENEKKTVPKVLVFGSFALILALGAGWYYLLSSSTAEKASVTAPTLQIRTILPYTRGATVTLDADSDPLSMIAARLSVSNPGLGNIFAVIPVENVGATEPAALARILSRTNAPSRLTRSLSGEYMIGLYSYDSENPFLIFKNTFFQNAYAGMLEWERSMKPDLLALIQIPRPDETISAETARFEDMTVSNIDARALRSRNGEVALIYAFADKDTIVITTSVTGLRQLLDRLLTVRTIQ